VAVLTTLAGCLLLLAPDPSALKGYDPKGGFGRTLYELEVAGPIDATLAAAIEEVATEATERDVILVRLNTFGGRVDAAGLARDALLRSRAATVALIDSRALSSGTLIALACQTVLMTPAASIGAATPMPLADDGTTSPPSEKAMSIMRAELRGTAEARGRPTAVVEAMVDPSLGLVGVAAPGPTIAMLPGNRLRSKPSATTATTAPPTSANLPRGRCHSRSTRVMSETSSRAGARAGATRAATGWAASGESAAG
jgi:membrane-bound serine protease (ClpP class)